MSNYELPTPDFTSRLTELIFELEHLREKTLKGTTPNWLFFDLKSVMQLLESMTSARIEGNRTTIMGVVDAVIDNKGENSDEQILEIFNIQKAISFIEQHLSRDGKINKKFILDLHKITVANLEREGSREPGRYRTTDVRISSSEHQPPTYMLINSMMDDLISFINEENKPQFDLLKMAYVHHRFAWIHPFDNGNGRVTRLVAYAMLVKQGFIDTDGFRILNPTAIFCSDRNKYYKMLACADSGENQDLLSWSEYVLEGIKSEIEKIDRLLDADFAKKEIILPSLELARSKEWLNDTEFKIMKIAMERDVIQASDILPLFGTTHSSRTKASRVINRMKEQGYLMAHPKMPRRYVLKFSNNYLLRGVMIQLDRHGFLPINANE